MYNFYTPKRLAQGRPHIGIYTLQTGPFSTIRQQNTTVGVSLTVVFSFVLQKNSHFGVLRSFEAKILPHRNIQRTMKYWMYFEDDGFSVGNKIDSKPCKSLYEAAQGRSFFTSSESCYLTPACYTKTAHPGRENPEIFPACLTAHSAHPPR